MATIALLVAVGACEASPPARPLPPTARAGAERSFSLSSEPTDEILRLTSSGGSTAEVTAYTLYGDGRLVWRVMAKKLAPTVPVVEVYDGYDVRDRREVKLSPAEVRRIIEPLVSSGLIDLTPGAARSAAAGAAVRDVGDLELEVQLESYSMGDQRPAPKTVVLRMPFYASAQGQLAPVGSMHRQFNRHLGLGR